MARRGEPPLRSGHSRLHPARRRDRRVRYPRTWRQAARAQLRRSHVPDRVDVALPVGGVPRAVLHPDGAGHAARGASTDPGHADHHRRHELRLAVGQREGGAGPRRYRGRHLDHHRRRRHDAGRAPFLQDAGLSVPAVALRLQPGRPAPRRRGRDRHRPGRQAGRWRHAAGAQGLRTGRQDAHASRRHRPAVCLPSPRLGGPGRPCDQDRGVARGHGQPHPGLHQDRRHPRARRRQAVREVRSRRDRPGRHAGRHRSHPAGVHRARRHPDPASREAGGGGAGGGRSGARGAARGLRRHPVGG